MSLTVWDTWLGRCHRSAPPVATLPGEGRPLSGIEGVSELFDGVVLTRQAEDALLVQAVLLDELHALLHQDGHHAGPEALLVGHRVHQTLPKHCGEAPGSRHVHTVESQNTQSHQSKRPNDSDRVVTGRHVTGC